jgi:hypothetical protein
MKKGVIFFHKNIQTLYPRRWIDICVNSVLNQSDRDFKIYEINYGGDNYSLFENREIDQDKEFHARNFDNHAEAMNFILDRAFEDRCDFVFNTNLDDFYSLDRIEKQMIELNKGCDIVSSNMRYVEEREGRDVTIKYINLSEGGNIENSLKGGHNVIAHPSVAISKNFWEGNRYNPEEIPMEDFLLWKRSIERGFKFSIVNEYLLSYRLHSMQITGDNSSLAGNMSPRAESSTSNINPINLR